MRRGEKAGTRSHLSLLSHCWKQSRQTLRDRRDGGGGYEALFREELASLSLKRNTVKRASFLLEKMTRLPARRAMRRHGHFIFRQLIHLCGCLLPRVTPSSRLYTLSALPLLALQLSLRSPGLLFQMRSVRRQINFLHLNCRGINFRTFLQSIHFMCYTIAGIIITFCSKINFIRHY